jgi:hypothetical protein
MRRPKMGGGSGGSYTPINLDSITQAANQRIKNAFGGENQILFVCESTDQAELVDRISKSEILKRRSFDNSVSGDLDLETKIEKSSLVLLFSNKTIESTHINNAVDFAVKSKKQIIYVKGDAVNSIPQHVTQFRIKTVSWGGLLEILAS